MIKNLFKGVILLLISCVIGFTALLAISLIPNHMVLNNLNHSVIAFEKEGYRPEITPYISSYLDNFTDALMLETTSQETSDSIVNKALLSYRYVGYEDDKELDPVETFIEYYGDEKDDVSFVKTTYARYWHGYQVFLKPALVVLNYPQIRIGNIILNVVLTIIIYIKMRKMLNIKIAVLYLLVWISLMPIVLFCSLQFSSVFYISTIAAIIILNIKIKTENAFSFFFVIGCLTSYFDLLTYPLITLCIPLCIYLLVYQMDQKEELKQVLFLSVAWGAGYFGMWIMKWILASVLTEKNIIGTTLQQIQIRSSNTVNEQKISYFSVLGKNIINFVKNPAPWIFIFQVLYYLIKRKGHKEKKGNAISFFLIAIYPFLWYLVTMNHSYIHAWFTFRELSISLMALGCMLITS